MLPTIMRHRPGYHDTREKPSGKHEARWADSDGSLRAKSFLTKTQAEKYALDKAKEVTDGIAGISIARKPISEALEAFLDRQLDPQTTALNERRMGEFLAVFPNLKYVGQITEDTINAYHAVLVKRGHNKGGQHHMLKVVRAFCNFCKRRKWMTEYPFEEITLPKSDFEGRPLTPAEKAAIHSIDPRHAIEDGYLVDAFRFGRQALLRISQVWRLRAKDYKDGMIWITGIKGQAPEWKPLTPIALEIVKRRAASKPPEGRLFDYWGTVHAMRKAVEEKVKRAGHPGIRFHDIAKVTGISELHEQGFSIPQLAHISNTTKETLVAHYIKADKAEAYAKYLAHAQTEPGPNLSPKRARSKLQQQTTLTRSKVQNSSNSESL